MTDAGINTIVSAGSTAALAAFVAWIKARTDQQIREMEERAKIRAEANAKQMDRFEIKVDGRLSQILEERSAAKMAEGNLVGRAEEKAEQGERDAHAEKKGNGP